MVSLLLAALWVGKMAPAQLWAGGWTQGCPKSERSWPLFLNFLEQSFGVDQKQIAKRIALGQPGLRGEGAAPSGSAETLRWSLCWRGASHLGVHKVPWTGRQPPTLPVGHCFRQCFLVRKSKPVSGTTVPAVFLNCRLMWGPIFSSEAHVSHVCHSQQHNLPTIPPLLKPVYLGQCIWGFFQGCLPTDVPNRHRSSP